MFYVDALHLGIALGPLAVYFVLLGIINLTARPFLTTGARDVAALGVAVSGLIVAGPMELFLPEAATSRLGAYVWLLLLAFYGLCLSLVVLLMRPRLVIYNTSPDQLRPMLAEVVAELDSTARWAGDSLVLPQHDVQLHVEMFGLMRSAQLVAAGPRQNMNGWKRLEQALAKVLRQTKSAPTSYGYALVTAGVLLIGLVTFQLVSDPQTVVQGVNEMLRQ